MALGVNTDFSGSALTSLTKLQQNLTQVNNQLSSGKRITNASIDPSGLAIYNNLSQQSQGADTANLNITEASSAVNVAQGATSTVQDVLSQVNSLAIEANNSFNSASDNAALQAQASAQIQEVNQIASQTNFNGTALVDGSNAGNTPPAAATTAIPTNTQTTSGGTVVASASASATTTSGTFNVTIDNSGNANVTFQDSATQTSTTVGSFAANSTTTFNGTTLNFGNFTSADAGSTATVQATAANPGSTAPSASVQSGANAGQTTNVDFANVSTTGLGISNIDLSNPQSATNSQGQIANAQAALNSANANLGAQSAALSAQFDNNNTLSNNLSAAASAIGDANQAQLSSQVSSDTLQQKITIAVLNQANLNYGHLNAYLSTYA